MRNRILWPLVVAGVLAVACSSSASNPGPSGLPTTLPPTTSSATSAPKTAAKIGHVFVINLENKGYTETWGAGSPATYLNSTLRPMGQLLTQYYGIGHASLDNYIAQISGQPPNAKTQADCVTYAEFTLTGVGDNGQALGQGCIYPVSVKTLADQLSAAGRTWKSYQEDMANSPTAPATCRHPAIGAIDPTLAARKGDMYATRHNPFVYFHSVIDSPACQTDVVALDQLTTDLASAARTPNLAYITPNLCHDGHDSPCVDGQPGGLTSADQWLSQWAAKILASPAYGTDGLLVVTFDEAELSGPQGDSASCCNTPPSPNSPKPGISGPGGGRVGAVVISARTKPATSNDTPYNHYALLCSMEDIFGVSHLGFAGAPGLQCFGKDVFNG